MLAGLFDPREVVEDQPVPGTVATGRQQPLATSRLTLGIGRLLRRHQGQGGQVVVDHDRQENQSTTPPQKRHVATFSNRLTALNRWLLQRPLRLRGSDPRDTLSEYSSCLGFDVS